jgi:serine protease
VKALQEAVRLADGGDLPSLLTTSPSLLVFESGISELMLEVAQVGADPLTVQDISAADEWIAEVTPLDVDQAGLGTYRVVVDRTVDGTGLPDGAYLSTLAFLASNGESSAATVFMRVGAPSGPGDAGLVFVALLDASRPGEIVDIVEAGTGGDHPYAFAELDAGIYFLAAGTDNDNDGLLCDEGEACGAYATLSLPDAIRLGTADITEREFLIGYRPDILAAQAAGAPSALERMGLR